MNIYRILRLSFNATSDTGQRGDANKTYSYFNSYARNKFLIWELYATVAYTKRLINREKKPPANIIISWLLDIIRQNRHRRKVNIVINKIIDTFRVYVVIKSGLYSCH